MNSAKKVLRDMVGDEGVEALEKAIFKRRTSAVIDPMEYYLPLMVVPRAILSWLIANVKPMRVGETKDVDFPGKDDIKIHIEKQDIDQYRAEFIQRGRVIHDFEKQSLPAMSAHMLTVGETYESFGEPEKAAEEVKDDKPKVEAPAESHSQDIVRTIMSMNNVAAPSADPEEAKWAFQHANIKELSSVIGKLVDALVAKKSSRDKAEDALDKVSETKVKDEQGKIETSKTPEEKFKEDMKAKDLPTDSEGQFKAAVQDMRERDKEKWKDGASNGPQAPECKEVKSGEEAAEGKVKKEEALTMAREEEGHSDRQKRKIREGRAEAEVGPTGTTENYHPEGKKTPIGMMQRRNSLRDLMRQKKPNLPKSELLEKPYVSDAQRRWAHTDAGTKALGGKEAVHHWDQESKGKDLPEKVHKQDILPEVQPTDPKTGKKLIANGPGSVTTSEPDPSKEMVSKAGEMPGGAAMPKKPAMPAAPKPPVGPSKNPAGAAAKQAQASARGDIAKPKTPHAPQMAAPQAGGPKPPAPPKPPTGPKPPAMKKDEYFRSKLGKTETHRATEEELFKSNCVHCGKPQFSKGMEGAQFDPCACFQVMKKDEEGKPFKFVEAIKKNDGTYELTFNKNADPEVVKAFLLTLKARLLIKRRFGV